MEPKDSLIEVANVEDAVTQAAVTALRATIGRHTLDDVLKDQESISAQLRQSLRDFRSADLRERKRSLVPQVFLGL